MLNATPRLHPAGMCLRPRRGRRPSFPRGQTVERHRSPVALRPSA